MKISTALLALLCAAPTAALVAADSKTGVTAYSTRTDPGLFENQNLARGARAAEILLALGEPDVRLARDVWAYWNFSANRADLDARGLDTLVITFTYGRVDTLRLTRRQNVEAAVARASTRNAPPTVVAAK